ncbi:unnamed protein product [Spirodela intermedia]|uniref:Uncharacterized protein n=1 Tax=Spirodela intermedia TaxID=51605 RepID=A0A7I8J616_SPIIN|nr:unnamed protein product [Spirodela intermedia]CAA6665489.1 unnamed protein product [Spirodela intermedia]
MTFTQNEYPGSCWRARREREKEKMVKFSKQFEGQLVPEWKEAFVDYWQLKKDLKKMQKPPGGQTPPQRPSRPSLRRALLSPLAMFARSFGYGRERDHGVHKKLGSSASKGDLYETELLEQFADTDAAKEFFSRLDLQLNKVNQFYKAKEGEFLERGESLRRQMEILVELKATLKQQRRGGSSAGDSKDDPSISCSIACEEDSIKRGGDDDDQLQECPVCDLDKKDPQAAESPGGDDPDKLDKAKREEGRPSSLSGGVFSCQGKSLRMNIPLTTPSRTISALTSLLWEDLVGQPKKLGSEGNGRLSVNRTKLHRAEKMIRGAFVELYKGLGYLSTYRNLNMMAFAKILKKFDKVTGKQVLPIYLKVVESSYFNSSGKLFVKHFTEEDRRKAMKYLRPNQRKGSHSLTFFIGLFTGCFISLFVGYCIMAHVAGMYTQRSDSIYMETTYPVLSMFSLLFLHLFLYGCDIFAWRMTRINYSFIFEFAPTRELKHRDVFLICSTAMSVVVGVMFAHLSLTVRGYSSGHVQAIPGLLVLMFLVLLVCPFNILYRQTRYRFIGVMRSIVLSPFYRVVMVDFFMADQLCSQVPMLRNLEYVACYYITGSYKRQDYGFCSTTTHYRDLAYAVSFLPYYWRAMQCARRWFDEGQTSHLANLGKYVSAMLAAGAKVAYEKEKGMGWLSLFDWGLLQVNSKNPWLRNELILRRKSVYYFSMVLNFVLRLAWLQSVLHLNFAGLDYRVTAFFSAALEVLRRGLWNFYRLENEHLNNVGKFRAVKTVPLPFHEVDED